jgi:hypothetical protein
LVGVIDWLNSRGPANQKCTIGNFCLGSGESGLAFQRVRVASATKILNVCGFRQTVVHYRDAGFYNQYKFFEWPAGAFIREENWFVFCPIIHDTRVWSSIEGLTFNSKYNVPRVNHYSYAWRILLSDSLKLQIPGGPPKSIQKKYSRINSKSQILLHNFLNISFAKEK